MSGLADSGYNAHVDPPLEFRNLPLVTVVAQIQFTEFSWTYEYRELRDLADHLERRDMRVESMETSAANPIFPFEIRMGRPAGLIARHASGVRFVAEPSRIAAHWDIQSGQDIGKPENYPRFGLLKEPIEEAVDVLGLAIAASDRPVICNILYSNFVQCKAFPSGHIVGHYLDSAYIPEQVLHSDRIHECKFVTGVSDADDYSVAIEARAPSEGLAGFVLSTSYGTRGLASGSISMLNHVHKGCNRWFLKTISEEAKSEWQLVR